MNLTSINPTNTVFDAKRLIGRKFDDTDVQNDLKHFPFTVKKGNDNKPMINVKYKNENKSFSSEQISSMVLQKMKETAESYLGEKVEKAHYERSDITFVPTCAVIGESMVMMVIADAILEKFGGDHINETRTNLANYLESAGPRG